MNRKGQKDQFAHIRSNLASDSQLGGKYRLAAFSLPWFLCSFPLTLPLESDDIAFEEDFPCRDALTPEFSRVDQEVDVLAGDLEVSHGITHAHEVGKFMHSVTGLTSYAIADVVL